jgi:hypothetical protein
VAVVLCAPPKVASGVALGVVDSVLWSWVSQACRSLASCWNGSVAPVADVAVPVLEVPVLEVPVLEVPVLEVPVLTGVSSGEGLARAVVALDQMLAARLLIDMAEAPDGEGLHGAAQAPCQFVAGILSRKGLPGWRHCPAGSATWEKSAGLACAASPAYCYALQQAEAALAIIDITTGQSFATVSAAILGSGAGDTIQVSAGSYVEDFPKIQHDLTIQGVGGLASFSSPPAGSSTGQGVLVTDANVTLDHLELSGSTVPDGNGAGVRQESGNLVISNSWIHNNQDGVLTNALPGATLTITGSEIDQNGAEDGYTHNIYAGQIGTLSVTDSYIHDALGGHEIKSRADTTIITDSRIQDGATADSGYSVDLPNGGNALLAGNTIEKGQNAQNYTFVHFTGETTPDASSSLIITGNTVINDSADQGGVPIFVWDQLTDATGNVYVPDISQNTFYGITPDTLYLLPDGTFSAGQDYALNNQFPTTPAPPLDNSAPYTVPEPGTAPLLAGVLLASHFLRRFGRRRMARRR